MPVENQHIKKPTKVNWLALSKEADCRHRTLHLLRGAQESFSLDQIRKLIFFYHCNFIIISTLVFDFLRKSQVLNQWELNQKSDKMLQFTVYSAPILVHWLDVPGFL